MTVYNLLMESFYYDGDDFVINDVASEIHSCGNNKTAKRYLENAIKDKLTDGKYTEDMLVRDGDDYACFQDKVDGNPRILYRLTIYEREIES